MDSGGGVRLESHNLRDLLRLKEEEQHSSFNHSTSSNGGGGRRSASGLTLLAILTENRGPPPRPPADEPLRGVQSSRTLLDIIREDQIGGGRRDGGRRWRNLTDKILLRHGGSSWSSVVTVEDNSRRSIQSDSNAHLGESSQSVLNAMVPIPHRNSSAQTESTNVPTQRSVTEDTDAATGEQPARASLMELLAENDFQLGFGGSSYSTVEEEEEILIGDNPGTGGGGSVESNCCVCMVRHKGAAFIPCGHTFCRVCSRELWIQRGNCPLCNNCISEILDIF